MLVGMLLFLGLTGPAFASDGLLDEAMNALAEGRDAAALGALRRGLADDPDHEIRCLLGKVALRTGRPAEALDVLTAVAAGAPCARQAAFGRAEALAALGRTDRLNTREAQRRQENRMRYDFIGEEASSGIEASTL